MTIFKPDEKTIIDKIVLGEGYSRTLINIFDSLSNLNGVRISVDPVTKSAEYLFQIANVNPTPQEFQAGIEKEIELTQKLITHLVVLERLEKDGLAFFYTRTKHSSGTIKFGAGAVNMPSFSMPIYDKKIIELLIRYLHVEIVPKSSLIHLQSNNYKTDEEIRFGIQMAATWSALVFSIIIGLVGIFNNYESGKASDKKYADIMRSLDANITKLDSSIRDLSSPHPVDYSSSLESIRQSIGLVSKEIEELSQKETIVNVKVDIPIEKNIKSLKAAAKVSND